MKNNCNSMKKLILFLLAFPVITTFAQEKDKPQVGWTAYLETYYQYDFNKPKDNNRPPFIYSHNRHNEFNLNLGFIKGTYNSERTRANLALAAGTYVNANYSNEPGILKNIFEANIGFKISKNKNIWIDAGILPSHIGFESAISKDCWTLTRSLLAENSPYFEAGAKLSYTSDNGKWLMSAMALNGWQRITRVNGNSLMSWGAQLQFKPSEKIVLNYSNFLGTDNPDSTRKIRFFHNLFGTFTLTDHLGLIAGFDIGTEGKNGAHNNWYSPVIIVKYSFNEKWSMSGRAEVYNDKKEVIITTGTPNGFQTSGYSVNIDFGPSKNILLRLEARNLRSKDAIFQKENNSVKGNFFITSSLAVNF